MQVAGDPPEVSSDPKSGPLFRAAAAARGAGIPVATLRVWERRYALSGARRAPSGHRLYSAADIERLRWIRHLAGLGHAVGMLAPLPLASLRRLVAGSAEAPPDPGPPWPAAATARVGAREGGATVVVGEAVAGRLRQIAPAPGTISAWADLDAAEAAAAADGGAFGLVARLVVRVPALQRDTALRVLAFARRLQAPCTLVLYGFGPETAASLLAAHGVAVRREPVSGADLGRWLADQAAPAVAAEPPPAQPRLADGETDAAPRPRRFDDRALARIAASASTVACECPRHLAELAAQLAGFESYSRECAARDPIDHGLHQRIARTAGRARALIEDALAEVIAAEGL
jgi:hypothetical protein